MFWEISVDVTNWGTQSSKSSISIYPLTVSTSLKYAAKFPANISNNYGLIEINKLQIDERQSG